MKLMNNSLGHARKEECRRWNKKEVIRHASLPYKSDVHI